jgi:putative ABC transport system permease protein
LSSSSQNGLLAEIERLGTDLLTVEAGRSFTGGGEGTARELVAVLGSAILIGASTGLMPAVRASRMPPTVALRTV